MPSLYFSPESGTVLEARDAHEATIVLGNRALRLANLVISNDFPFEQGDYPVRPYGLWGEDEVIRTGRQIAQDLAELEPPHSLSGVIIDKLHILGAFPGRAYFSTASNGPFNGLSDFYRAIDSQAILRNPRQLKTANAEFDGLPAEQFIALIIHRCNTLFEFSDGKSFEGPITTSIIEQLNYMGLSPSENYILGRFGGLREINEHLGFPNIRAWDDYDFIQYGADVIELNGADLLTPRNINLLAGAKYGPRYHTIHHRFGWPKFKVLATEEFERRQTAAKAHHAAVVAFYSENVGATHELPFETQARYRGMLVLADYFKLPHNSLPTNPSQEHVNMLVLKISKTNKIPIADVEIAAEILLVTDDLWPTPKKLRPPVISKALAKTNN